ncbi:unnamed protein product [Protopolystoma xenopodis]|uniref:Uncharacterized protein n=1 Tax=Protopolystoma xenopodis TaxID=117903 RepID=A0A3S5CN89_9PLAT|nr:unnamed protein product [Protopolystoma xenopodis]
MFCSLSRLFLTTPHTRELFHSGRSQQAGTPDFPLAQASIERQRVSFHPATLLASLGHKSAGLAKYVR